MFIRILIIIIIITIVIVIEFYFGNDQCAPILIQEKLSNYM